MKIKAKMYIYSFILVPMVLKYQGQIGPPMYFSTYRTKIQWSFFRGTTTVLGGICSCILVPDHPLVFFNRFTSKMAQNACKKLYVTWKPIIFLGGSGAVKIENTLFSRFWPYKCINIFVSQPIIMVV